jgi:hypothetical protein
VTEPFPRQENTVRKIIKFDKRPRYDSKGRNGFIMTTGVEIADLGISEYLIDDPIVEAAIVLQPLNRRGEVSDACRISIAHSALPEVIKALQEIAGLHDERTDPTGHQSYCAAVKGYGECDCECYGEYAAAVQI